MTQGERVREVRKSLGLTLEKFGEKIGMKKNSVSQIENGKNNVTDANVKAICREFNISEEWLRTGSGNMRIPVEDEAACMMLLRGSWLHIKNLMALPGKLLINSFWMPFLREAAHKRLLSLLPPIFPISPLMKKWSFTGKN